MDKKEKQAMYKFLLLTFPFWIGGIVALFLPVARSLNEKPEITHQKNDLSFKGYS